MEKNNWKKQSHSNICCIFVVVCSISRTVLSRTGSHLLHNLTCCSFANHDSDRIRIVFLVFESTNIRREEEKRLSQLHLDRESDQELRKQLYEMSNMQQINSDHNFGYVAFSRPEDEYFQQGSTQSCTVL